MDVASLKVRFESEGEEQVGRAADSLSGKLQGMSQRAQKAGTMMTLGVTTPLLVMGKTMFSASSDMEESLSKVNTVFGTSASGVLDWANTSSTAFGMAEVDALGAAGTFGNLFTGMGLSKEAASGMSMDMIQLAADMASFNNVPIDVALAAIQSGLVGEAEPMRQFGVLLNDASVQAKAMEMGLVDANGEVSEQNKVLARQALIMEQTSAAQGDFTRTQDGAANSAKIARAEFRNMQATMGQYLLPTVTKAIKGFTGLMQGIMRLSPNMQKLILVVAGIAAAIGPLLIGLGMMLPAITAIGTAIAFLLSPVGLVIIAVAALAAGAIYAYTHFEGFKKVVDTVASALRDFATGAIKAVIDAWNTLTSAFKAEGWTGVWNAIKQGAIDAFNGIIEFGMDTIQRLVNAINSVDFGGLLSGAWDAIQTGLQFAWDAITSLNWRDFIPNIDWGAFVALLDWAQFIGGKIVDIAQWVWDKIGGFFPSASVITGAIGDFAAWVWGKIQNFFPSALLVTTAIGDFAGWIWGKISGFFPASSLITGNMISDFAQFVWNKIKSIFPSSSLITGNMIADFAGFIWMKIKTYFPAASLITGSIGAFTTWIWGKIYSYFPSSTLITDSIGDFTTWIWGKISSFFPSTALITGSIGDFGAWLYEKIGSPTLSMPSAGDIARAIAEYAGLQDGGNSSSSDKNSEAGDWYDGGQFDPGQGEQQGFKFGGKDPFAGLGGTAPIPDFTGFKNALALAKASIVTFVADSIGVMGGWVTGIGNIIGTFSSVFHPPISAGTSAGKQSFVTFVADTIGVMGGWAGGLAAMVGSTMAAFQAQTSSGTFAGKSSFIAFVSSTIGVMGGWSGGVRANVTGTMSAFQSTISSGTSSGKTSFVTFVSGTIGVMGGWSGGIRNIVSGAMSGMVGSARSGASDMASALRNGADRAADGVRSALSQIPGIINGIAGQGAAAAYNAGSAIGAGFANGLTAYLGQIRSAAAQMVSAAAAAVTAKAMISSPSKLFKRFGVYIGQGMEEGIGAMIPAVQRTSAELVNAPSRARITPIGAGQQATGSQAPSNVTYITVNALKTDELQHLLDQAARGDAHARAWQQPDSITQFLKKSS